MAEKNVLLGCGISVAICATAEKLRQLAVHSSFLVFVTYTGGFLPFYSQDI
jgi:hypothetical protein